MTRPEIPELLQEARQSYVTHRAEVIQHLCDIGLNQDQAKRIWLYFVLKRYYSTEECWNTPSIRDMWLTLLEHQNGK